jgi:hypothetical protein
MPKPTGKECAMKTTFADNMLFIGLMILTLVCLGMLGFVPELRDDDTFKTLSQAIVITGLIGLISKAQQDQQAKQTVATTTAVAAAVAAQPTPPPSPAGPTQTDNVIIDTNTTEINTNGRPSQTTGGTAGPSLGAGNGGTDEVGAVGPDPLDDPEFSIPASAGVGGESQR